MEKLQIPREYFRIASRFMKEIGLYPYWIKYLYSPKTYKNWYEDRKKYTPVDVFGCTCITDFLSQHNKSLPMGYCLFEIYTRYLNEAYPELEGMYPRGDACPSCFLKVDKESKKIELNYK